MTLTQRQCRWTEPLRISGAVSGDDVLSLFTDVRDDLVSDRGYDVMAMSNGDRIFWHYVTTANRNGPMPESNQGAIAFSGGTGAFRGIYGHGTFRSKSGPDGRVTVRLEAEYTIPGRLPYDRGSDDSFRAARVSKRTFIEWRVRSDDSFRAARVSKRTFIEWRVHSLTVAAQTILSEPRASASGHLSNGVSTPLRSRL